MIINHCCPGKPIRDSAKEVVFGLTKAFNSHRQRSFSCISSFPLYVLSFAPPKESTKEKGCNLKAAAPLQAGPSFNVPTGHIGLIASGTFGPPARPLAPKRNASGLTLQAAAVAQRHRKPPRWGCIPSRTCHHSTFNAASFQYSLTALSEYHTGSLSWQYQTAKPK